MILGIPLSLIIWRSRAYGPIMPDRVVFDNIIDALVQGSGYERVAVQGCSDRTIRRRLAEWAEAGIAEQVHAVALRAYDLIIGLELDHISVDGCITKAPAAVTRPDRPQWGRSGLVT